MNTVPYFVDLSDHYNIEANSNMVVSPLTHASLSTKGTKVGVSRTMKQKQTMKNHQSPRVVPANKKQKALKTSTAIQKDGRVQTTKKKGRPKLNDSVSTEEDTEDDKSISKGDLEDLYEDEEDDNEDDKDAEILIDDDNVDNGMTWANINDDN